MSEPTSLPRVASFEKVSFEQFEQAISSTLPNIKKEKLIKMYESILLPTRATKGSAGYDIHAPFGFLLPAGGSFKFPTGLRAKIKEGWVLTCHPRSGLGFKYRISLANTVGVIDSDYYGSDNEGHIYIKLCNNGEEDIKVDPLDKVVQGIFLPFGITEDDSADGERNGGFGSTGA